MMEYEILTGLLYAKSHEWARVSGSTVTVGISAYAVQQMDKEIVNVDLCAKGTVLTNGQSFGVVDSVKAAFDLYAPVGGEVIEVNNSVVKTPELVAISPYGEGWMIKMTLSQPSDLNDLLKPEDYKKLIETAEE